MDHCDRCAELETKLAEMRDWLRDDQAEKIKLRDNLEKLKQERDHFADQATKQSAMADDARRARDEIQDAFRDGQLNRNWEKWQARSKELHNNRLADWWIHGHARELDFERAVRAEEARDEARAELAALWQVKVKPGESHFDAIMRDPECRRTYCEEAVIAERVAVVEARCEALIETARKLITALESESGWDSQSDDVQELTHELRAALKQSDR